MAVKKEYIKIRGANEHNLKHIDIDIPINFLRVDLSDTNLRVCDFYQINSPCPTNNGILCLSPRSYSDKNFSKISTPPSFRYYVDNNKSIKGKFYNRFFNYNENKYWYIIDGLLGVGKGKSFEENLSGGFYNGIQDKQFKIVYSGISSNCCETANSVYYHYKFKDGTPFGIKEE